MKHNFVEVKVEVCQIDYLVPQIDVGMMLQKGVISEILEIIIFKMSMVSTLLVLLQVQT